MATLLDLIAGPQGDPEQSGLNRAIFGSRRAPREQGNEALIRALLGTEGGTIESASRGLEFRKPGQLIDLPKLRGAERLQTQLSQRGRQGGGPAFRSETAGPQAVAGPSLAELMGISREAGKTIESAPGVRKQIQQGKAAPKGGARARSFNMRSVVQGIMTNRDKFNLITGKVTGAVKEDIAAAIIEAERTKLDAGAGRLGARDFEAMKGMFAGLTPQVWAEGVALADEAEARIAQQGAAGRAQRR